MNSADFYFKVSKDYPDFSIAVELALNQGEFFSLLGPSGCGKTTFLRLIAGLERATDSRIIVQRQDVSDLSPANRRIGMVFQDYALFPHLNVIENIKYGLKNQKLTAGAIKAKTEELLTLFELEHLATRDIHQLSGGEKQRVALARALAPEPLLLLMDEPFSALDYGLRNRLRNELQMYQRKLGFTCIFVTHQQEEALIVSDRLGVMQQGALIQYGTPLEIYEKPVNRFVAEFVGEANLLTGNVVANDNNNNNFRLELPELKSEVPLFGFDYSTGRYSILIRPEEIIVNYQELLEGTIGIKARITKLEYLGYMMRMELEVNDLKLKAATFNQDYSQFKIGAEIRIGFNLTNPKFVK